MWEPARTDRIEQRSVPSHLRHRAIYHRAIYEVEKAGGEIYGIPASVGDLHCSTARLSIFVSRAHVLRKLVTTKNETATGQGTDERLSVCHVFA